jgi:hypothetical protein
MTLTDLLIPALTNQLAALSGWLDKAEAFAASRGEAPEALLPLRLAPDMWPLASQLYILAFQAQEPVYRLRGEPVPDAVVADAAAFLAKVAPGALDAAADRPLAHDLPMGMVFDMTGFTYVRDWALPQCGFHHAMTYALLRHAGVPLGKIDFVPHMFAYLRPGTMPAGG